MTDGLTEAARTGIQTALRACLKIDSAVLFGSRAMGNFKPASDVDLALEGDGITLEDLLFVKAKISQLNLPVDVDLVIRNKIDNPDLEKHIEQFGRVWYLKERGSR